MFEKKKSVLLFLLPGLCMLLIFYIIPFFSGIGYSLMDGSYKNEFVGLKNYREIWQNSILPTGAIPFLNKGSDPLGSFLRGAPAHIQVDGVHLLIEGQAGEAPLNDVLLPHPGPYIPQEALTQGVGGDIQGDFHRLVFHPLQAGEDLLKYFLLVDHPAEDDILVPGIGQKGPQ